MERALVTLCLCGSAALAQPRTPAQVCLSSYERAQSARRDGKLIEARDAAIACSSESCPAALTGDCVKWVGELQAMLPGLVFDVRLPDGSSVTDARILLDGAPLTSKLDGKAIPVDPGPHTVTVKATGYDDVVMKVVALEGDRARKVAVVLVRPGGKPSAEQPPGFATHRPVPLITFIAGGTAIATAIAGGIVAGVGLGERAALETCRPLCAVERVASAARLLALADGLFIGSALMAGLTAVSFFLRPEVPVWISLVPSSSPAIAIGGRLP